MSFWDGLVSARSHIVFVTAMIIAFIVIIRLEQFAETKRNPCDCNDISIRTEQLK